MLESMNIGDCASLETRCGSLIAIRINLVGFVNRKQRTGDRIRKQHQGCVVILSVPMAVLDPAECDLKRDGVVFAVAQLVADEWPVNSDNAPGIALDNRFRSIESYIG